VPTWAEGWSKQDAIFSTRTCILRMVIRIKPPFSFYSPFGRAVSQPFLTERTTSNFGLKPHFKRVRSIYSMRMPLTPSTTARTPSTLPFNAVGRAENDYIQFFAHRKFRYWSRLVNFVCKVVVSLPDMHRGRLRLARDREELQGSVVRAGAGTYSPECIFLVGRAWRSSVDTNGPGAGVHT
jgi:hypothetical protein